MNSFKGTKAWCAVLFSATVALAGLAAFAQDQAAQPAGAAAASEPIAASAPAPAPAPVTESAAAAAAPAAEPVAEPAAAAPAPAAAHEAVSAPASAPAPESSPAAPTVPTPPKDALTLYFLDVDMGDSTLITTPAGKTILIDGGKGGSGYKRKDKGKTVIIPFLKEHGIKRLDTVIMTHADEDHIGGLVTVVSRTTPESDYPVEIGEFLDPGQAHTTFLYQELLKAVMSRSEIKYRNPRAGEKLDFGEGVTAEVLNPAEAKGTSNAASVVLKVTRGDISFLLAGDAEATAEKRMIEAYGDKLKSTVLKAGHHGSGASSSDELLKLVKPEVVVIQVGTKNKFLLPDKKTLERFEATGAKIYRTDYQGTITITTNGKGYAVSTDREAPPMKDRWDTVPTLSEDEKVDINSASAAELGKLPRIGKGLAEEIIKRRPYTKVEDLRRVPGIGVKILERLRPLVKVGPPVAATPGAEKPAGAEDAAAAPAGETKVNINTASAEELAKVPGIGPAIAKAIIAGRPYEDVGELKNILGIGPAKFEKMLPHITK